MAPLTRGLELLGWAVSYALASTRLATPQRLPCPTPCAGWDLGLLLHHVSDSVGVLHEAITAGCIGSGPAPGDDGPGPDPVSGLYRRAGRLLAACAPAGPGPGTWSPSVTANWPRRWSWPPGPSRSPSMAGTSRSRAAATGRSRRTWRLLLLPIAPLFITPGTRAGLFADPVPVPGRACPGDQLVAFLGRQPHCPAAPGPS